MSAKIQRLPLKPNTPGMSEDMREQLRQLDKEELIDIFFKSES